MWVVYEVETTYLVKKADRSEAYKSEAAAKAGMKRAESLPKYEGIKLAVAEKTDFHKRIEKQETRKNLMSGNEFTQPVNTPCYLDPSTETYWSM